MLVFEGADGDLREAARVYSLIHKGVRRWRFYGVPSRLVASADRRCEASAQAIARAWQRAERADLKRIERLYRAAIGARARLRALVERRAAALRLDLRIKDLGEVLDTLVQLDVPDPRLGQRGRRWRLLVVLSTVVFCGLWQCCTSGLWPWVTLALMVPPIGIGWAILSASFIGTGFLSRGAVRKVLTAVIVTVTAAALWGLQHTTWEPLLIPSMLPFGIAVLLWLGMSLKRHLS